MLSLCLAFTPTNNIFATQRIAAQFRAQLQTRARRHAGVFPLKCYLNILHEGVLITYKNAFYCVVFHFYTPGEQNGKTCKSFHARPSLKHFITCSELNINDRVSPSLPVMCTGIKAFVPHRTSPLRTISFPKIKLAEKLFSSLMA